jgi:4a-hydroxytetrahydrobiopterin dehydratase
MTTTATANMCAPCASLDKDALLSIGQVQAQVSDMPLWSLEEKDGVPCISRRFTVKHFQAGLDALNAIGAIAERQGHHPDLHLTNYREVTITLWTHKLGGLTQNDLTLAQIFDVEVDVVYSPKWLKEHPQAQVLPKENYCPS